MTESTLTRMLQELIEQAQATPGTAFEKPLNGGLRLHMRKDGLSYVLSIIRTVTPPSAQEWNVVIAYWPWKLGALDWSNSGVTADGKYFKQVRIPAI